MNDWLRRGQQSHRIVKRNVGQGIYPLLFSQQLMHQLRRVVHRIDGVSLNNPNIECPIVIAGLPRTGTTFLHRQLHQWGIGKGQTLFEQLFPSRA